MTGLAGTARAAKRVRRWRVVALAVALTACLVTVSAGVAAWRELRFAAARDRADSVFSGARLVPWEGRQVFEPAPGTRQIPLALGGPDSPDTVGRTLLLPFRTEAGHRLRVRLVQLENASEDPPVLAVSLTGQSPTLVATSPGGGMPPDAIEIGTTRVYEVDPVGWTRCGQNEVRVEAVAGSAIAIARIELRLWDTFPGGEWRRRGAAAAGLWLLAAAVGLSASWPADAAARRRWLRRAVARTALATAAALTGLALAEAAVRWFAPRSEKVRNLLYSSRDTWSAPRRGTFLEWLQGHPCASAPCSLGADGFRLNRHGFRTHDYAVAKRQGVKRVVGVGDSFMFRGGPVAYPDKWFVRLERLVRDADPQQPFEFINLGQSCIGVPTATEILRHEALRLEPDLVVWSLYLGNDVSDEQYGAPLLPDDLVAMKSPAHSALPATATLRRPRSALLRLGTHLWQTARYEPRLLVTPCEPTVAELDPGGPCGTIEETPWPYEPGAKVLSDESFERYLRGQLDLLYRADGRRRVDAGVQLLLARMEAERALLEGFEVLLVIIPDELQVSAETRQRAVRTWPALATTTLDFDYPHRAVVGGLRRLGYDLVDLTPPFEEATAGGAELYHPNDSHLSLAGNHLAADLVATALTERRFWSRE